VSVESVEQRLHGGDDVPWPAMVGQPRDAAGQSGDGVGRVGSRTVPSGAPSGELDPRGAALGERDRVQPPAVGQMQAVPAGLADRGGHAGKQVCVLAHQIARPELAVVLLVGHERQHDVPRRDIARTRPTQRDAEHRRVHRLHVQGAATPHGAVAHLAAERIDAPVLRGGRDDVEVTVHEQRRRSPVAAGDADDRAGTPRFRLDDRRQVAGVAQLPGHPVGGVPLAVGLPVAVVSRVEADQRRTDGDEIGIPDWCSQ
jgi:hypothetical protein